MNGTEYQILAARTIPSRDTDAYVITEDDIAILWAAMGLAGEAGETLDEIKKAIFHRHGIDRVKLSKEVGDMLWYAAMLCTVTGLDMDKVMQENIDKLRERYPEGFSTADSLKRVDVQDETIHIWTCACGTVNNLRHVQCAVCQRPRGARE